MAKNPFRASTMRRHDFPIILHQLEGFGAAVCLDLATANRLRWLAFMRGAQVLFQGIG